MKNGILFILSMLCFMTLGMNDCFAENAQFNDSSHVKGLECNNLQLEAVFDYKTTDFVESFNDFYSSSGDRQICDYSLSKMPLHNFLHRNDEKQFLSPSRKIDKYHNIETHRTIKSTIVIDFHRNQWNL